MARPLSRPGLGSTTRRALCWHLAQGETKESAAAKAGLPNSDRIHAFARTTEFASELREAMRDHLSLNLAPRAVATLREIMEDTAVQSRVRVDAARILLEKAGYGAGEERKRSVADPDEMESWSEEDLRKFITTASDKLREEADRRFKGAKLIENDSVEDVMS